MNPVCGAANKRGEAVVRQGSRSARDRVRLEGTVFQSAAEPCLRLWAQDQGLKEMEAMSGGVDREKA